MENRYYTMEKTILDVEKLIYGNGKFKLNTVTASEHWKISMEQGETNFGYLKTDLEIWNMKSCQ